MFNIKLSDKIIGKSIVKIKFGSHLYGTNTEDSDLDFKGIYIPNRKDIFLQNVGGGFRNDSKKNKSVKNSKNDIDIEYYTIHHFLKLAIKGEINTLDMLHAPKSMLIYSSEIWEDLVRKRHFFYTKKLNSFVGYARKQAAKYGLKGSRLSDVEEVIYFFNQFEENTKLSYIWNILPEGEHINKFNNLQIREYQVCGRNIQETVPVKYALQILNTFYKNYGSRAKLAEQNKGIDWKAISHALRAAYQVKEIFKYKTITFPLIQSRFLKKVKRGKLNYKKVIGVLEDLMDEIEELSLESNFPEEVNKEYWDNWLYETIHRHFSNEEFKFHMDNQ